MDQADHLLELQTNLANVAAALFEPATVQDTLQRIVDLTVAAVDGCETAGIVVIEGRRTRTAAVSGPLARVIEELQADAGDGPWLDASIESSTVHAEDLLDDPRWPTFASAAVAIGIRSVLVCSLTTRQRSALN